MGLPVLFGAVLIGSAFYMRSQQTEEVGSVAVVSTSERQYIPAADADGDGIPDWEEELQGRVFEAIPDPLASTNSATSTTAQSTESLSYTEAFGRSFFQDFVESKIDGAPIGGQAEFLSSAVSSIEDQTQDRLYTRGDITIIPATAASIHTYGNNVSEIIIRHTIIKEDEEANILARALNENNPAILEKLAPMKNVYEQSLKETLLVPVPETYVQHHLNVLNTYQAVLTDITAMEQAFTDPLFTLARMKRYGDNVLGLYFAFVNLHTAFTNEGIIYAEDEPGYFFQYFEQ